jgi:nucleoside-diphosphate-sugar epimerase
MRIFVAGGSGTIGVPLVRALVADGHDVIALTRSPEKEPMLRGLGAVPVLADVFDLDRLKMVVREARPTHVIHQLTNLPKEGVSHPSDMDATNRLRHEGTRHLLEAAVGAGARRFIGGSFALFQVELPPELRAAEPGREALQSMESQILEASRAGRIEGVVLRYGLWYSADNPSTQKLVRLVRRRWLPVVRNDRGRLPFIHLDDAVRATVAALDRAPAGSVYDIVDDRPVSMSEAVSEIAARVGARPPLAVPPWVPRLLTPYMAAMVRMQVPLSNAKAKAELGWTPRYPTIREGAEELVRAA